MLFQCSHYTPGRFTEENRKQTRPLTEGKMQNAKALFFFLFLISQSTLN